MHTIWLGLDFATSVTSLRLSVKMSTGFAFSKPINELFPDIFDERLRFKPGFEQVISTSVKEVDWLTDSRHSLILWRLFSCFCHSQKREILTPTCGMAKKWHFPTEIKASFRRELITIVGLHDTTRDRHDLWWSDRERLLHAYRSDSWPNGQMRKNGKLRAQRGPLVCFAAK